MTLMHTRARATQHEPLAVEAPATAPLRDEAVVGFDNIYGTRAPANHFAGIHFAFPAATFDTPIGPAHFAIATLDQRGRLSDRSAIRRLDWRPGRILSLSVGEQAAVVSRADEGTSRITPSGYLHLPAGIRNGWSLHSGDRVLLVASLSKRQLVIYPTSVLAAALSLYEPSLWQLA
ncbi:hypothetical protein [Nocardia sp. NPDC005745]|uniref:hypothetical protein n=1 Tax=Nocardia sp. NPDC005745 TaxID=3157061 RepID=UPI0033D9CC29